MGYQHLQGTTFLICLFTDQLIHRAADNSLRILMNGVDNFLKLPPANLVNIRCVRHQHDDCADMQSQTRDIINNAKFNQILPIIYEILSISDESKH